MYLNYNVHNFGFEVLKFGCELHMCKMVKSKIVIEVVCILVLKFYP